MEWRHPLHYEDLSAVVLHPNLGGPYCRGTSRQRGLVQGLTRVWSSMRDFYLEVSPTAPDKAWHSSPWLAQLHVPGLAPLPLGQKPTWPTHLAICLCNSAPDSTIPATL